MALLPSNVYRQSRGRGTRDYCTRKQVHSRYVSALPGQAHCVVPSRCVGTPRGGSTRKRANERTNERMDEWPACCVFRHMRSKGITLLGLARTVRTVGGPGEHPDFRNLVEVRTARVADIVDYR